MGERSIEGNIWRYKVFSAFAHTPLFISVVVLFFTANGLDMFDVFLLQSIFAVAVVVLEVPTGMVADRLGKRRSIIWAMNTQVAGWVAYGLGDGFWPFLGAEVLLALGAALYSGAHTALLYDSLVALDRRDEYRRLQGEAHSVQLVSFAFFTLIGGIVGHFSLRATVWASMLGPIVALCIALGFVEVRRVELPTSIAESLRGYRALLGAALRFVFKHRLVRWYILLMSVTSGALMWLLWLYQPYMEAGGLPVWFFGVAFALFNLVAAFSSRKADAFVKWVGEDRSVLVLMGLIIAPLFLMAGFVGPLAFMLIFGHQLARGMLGPVISDRILRYTFADKRATVLSLMSMSAKLFFAVTAPVIGYIAVEDDLSLTFLSEGAFMVVVYAALWFIYRRVPRKYFKVKADVEAQV